MFPAIYKYTGGGGGGRGRGWCTYVDIEENTCACK